MRTFSSLKICKIILLRTFFTNTHKENIHLCKANKSMLASILEDGTAYDDESA